MKALRGSLRVGEKKGCGGCGDWRNFSSVVSTGDESWRRNNTSTNNSNLLAQLSLQHDLCLGNLHDN